MKIYSKDNNIYLEEVEDFNLTQTLECGQCFHFVKINDGEYGLVHRDKLLHVKEERGTVIFYDVNEDDFENIWKVYFDLDRDYGSIKSQLLKRDDKLKASIEAMYGVRLLNQDFFETLISFIISQNKQIPHIKQLVAQISKKYGSYLGNIGDEEFYSFPDVQKMHEVTLEELYECKTGFRAPYIYDAVDNVYKGTINEKELRILDDSGCLERLMLIKGVGTKVANCVMLFSLGFRASFPVDVWIKRICEEMYFGKETSKEEIQKFAADWFGDLGGYAQQYLFYYGKENKIGKNNKSKKNGEKD